MHLAPSTPSAPAALACCLHCGTALLTQDQAGFCCAGCRSVHALISGAGLGRYYELGGMQAGPVPELQLARRDRNWLLPIAQSVRERGAAGLSLKLQGVRCAACVWLIQELFARHTGAQRVVVNTGRGALTLWARPGFDLSAFVIEIESFGYLVAAQGTAPVDRTGDDLLVRTGVCMALGGNAMMFSAAIYLGLREGPLYQLLHTLNFACATLAVMIGGPTFMRSAFSALRKGVLHLDVPIALGITLSYGAALWSFASGQTQAAYYDALAIFIALMLLGRLLKERIVRANQQQLLDDDGVDRLLARKVSGASVQLTPVTGLRADDELIVPAGDLVPVPCELGSESASCSLDWINGESEPVAYTRGDLIPAGAFNAGLSALHVRAISDFASSSLADLLADTRRAQTVRDAQRGHRFSVAYVSTVLLAAGSGFAYWTWAAGSWVRGLEVATAISVVTCPCALGIATPLAYDLVTAGLRRAGLFVRTSHFLDRMLAVRRIAFDKTGTLTTGRLDLVEEGALAALPAQQRDVLYTMVSASVHPKSVAVQRALDAQGARLVAELQVGELPGHGLQARCDARDYRLGHDAWASAVASDERDVHASQLGRSEPLEQASQADHAAADDLVFAVDGQPVCRLRTRERLRLDAVSELARLSRLGQESWILSGDDPRRVHQLAQTLGVPAQRALGGLSPEDKAQWIAQHDRDDVLMIGDGINDSLAVQRAFVSGTPSIDRAFMPQRSDFYFVTPGLAPIGLSLRAARKLHAVVRGNQAFAVLYNAGVVSVALMGLMKPWMAAVLMPLSSIVVLCATSWSLSARSALWKS